MDDVKDKDRRREEKTVLSAREQEARPQEKENREERERHWQFVDREDRKDREPLRKEERTVDRDRESAELTRMIGWRFHLLPYMLSISYPQIGQAT